MSSPKSFQFLRMFFWRFCTILGSFLDPFLVLLNHFWQMLATLGILGCLCNTFGRPWASFGFHLRALGAAWSPWAPILVSEIDVSLIFGRFGPPNWQKSSKFASKVQSKLESKFESKFESTFKSKFESKFQSHYVNRLSSTDAAVSAKRSQLVSLCQNIIWLK